MISEDLPLKNSYTGTLRPEHILYGYIEFWRSALMALGDLDHKMAAMALLNNYKLHLRW